MIFLFLNNAASAGENSESEGELKEMIEILHMLENYDELSSDEVYEYLEKNTEASEIPDNGGDKEDGGMK